MIPDQKKRPDKKERKPEPSMGPDEEGEVPLEPDQIPSKDSGAWVKRRGGDAKQEKPRPR